jgi:hypothetical protein
MVRAHGLRMIKARSGYIAWPFAGTYVPRGPLGIVFGCGLILTAFVTHDSATLPVLRHSMRCPGFSI